MYAFVLCLSLLALEAIAAADSAHAPGCNGDHSTLMMTTPVASFQRGEYDDPMDWLDHFTVDVAGGTCGGFWASEVDSVVVFPSCYYLNGELKQFHTIRPLEGGYAGIFDFTYAIYGEDWREPAVPLLAPLEMIVIPDTYQSVSYLGNPQGTLKYVSLPNGPFHARERLLQNTDGITFLVVKDSEAHQYCVEQGLKYAFREEYCRYATPSQAANLLAFDADALLASVSGKDGGSMTADGAATAEQPGQQEALEITFMSGSSLFWPVLEQEYMFEIGWQLNHEPIAGRGFNVYLVDMSDPENTLRLNDACVTDTTFRCSSAVLPEILGEYDIINVYVRVDYVDMATGQVICTDMTSGDCFRYICTRNQLKHYVDSLQLGYQAVVLMHDILYSGQYQIGDQTYHNDMNRVFYVTAELYKTISGDLEELQLLPQARGALMAKSVMEQLASTKDQTAIERKDILQVLEIAGFDMELIRQADAQDARKAWQAYMQMYDAVGTQALTHDAFYEYLNKLIVSQKTEIYSTMFEQTELLVDVLDILLDVCQEYCSYQSVTREDVQPYIDAFSDLGDSSMDYAAQYLKDMTKDSRSQIQFLLITHGCQCTADFAVDKAYEALTAAVLGSKWKLFVDGTNLVANLSFNAADGFSAQIELMTTVQMAHPIRKKLADSFSGLIGNQVGSYEQYMKDYYQPFVELKDRMLAMTSLEFEKYAAVRETALESPVGGVVISVADFLSGKEEDIRDKPAEEYLKEVKAYIEPALTQYYQVFIEPYSW